MGRGSRQSDHAIGIRRSRKHPPRLPLTAEERQRVEAQMLSFDDGSVFSHADELRLPGSKYAAAVSVKPARGEILYDRQGVGLMATRHPERPDHIYFVALFQSKPDLPSEEVLVAAARHDETDAVGADMLGLVERLAELRSAGWLLEASTATGGWRATNTVEVLHPLTYEISNWIKRPSDPRKPSSPKQVKRMLDYIARNYDLPESTSTADRSLAALKEKAQRRGDGELMRMALVRWPEADTSTLERIVDEAQRALDDGHPNPMNALQSAYLHIADTPTERPSWELEAKLGPTGYSLALAERLFDGGASESAVDAAGGPGAYALLQSHSRYEEPIGQHHQSSADRPSWEREVKLGPTGPSVSLAQCLFASGASEEAVDAAGGKGAYALLSYTAQYDQGAS